MIGISLVGQPELANFCFIFLWQVGHNLYLAVSHCLLPCKVYWQVAAIPMLQVSS